MKIFNPYTGETTTITWKLPQVSKQTLNEMQDRILAHYKETEQFIDDVEFIDKLINIDDYPVHTVLDTSLFAIANYTAFDDLLIPAIDKHLRSSKGPLYIAEYSTDSGSVIVVIMSASASGWVAPDNGDN